ncbi:pyrroline-5-carboxylate reductase [Gloeothece citriformis PCC 7424]|uniref:Pyrroline-5-carboxylate reductase n=1 Tax=Gloeothece citriformis (strain PCC 7424) TaxID=65393 RepID=B7KDJ1_GLOC7|nr:pyrroline-5-carboxylate reductase [Gloeothece citriformis]ACK69011.1 pyrroline-5-carboxylate reductase [Gloeothece citriformis PCC 7424]
MSIRLGIIGGGVMAEAILSRLIEQNIYPPDAVLVSEPQPQRREFLRKTYKVQVTSDNRETTTAQDVLLLAVKPQILDKVAENLAHLFPKRYPPLILSILAGVTLKRLEAIFSEQAIIRVMPNTPATVGAGITAIAAGKKVEPEHLASARSIFAAVGEVVEVPESLMDGVTGLSGSGPAFVAIMIEALADGGVAAGLPRPIAAQLALQTVLGTAQLLQQTKLHPAQLKDQVTSPGGTTIAGVTQLEKSGFRAAIIEAVMAAKQRSHELGR